MTPSDRLEALRERLLDLTFKNRLLNHSDLGRRILKVRRVALGELYQLLVEESKSFTVSSSFSDSLSSASGESESVAPASDITMEPFEDNGIDLTPWLQRRKLPIALPPLGLENRLRAMHSQFRALIEATGSNFLYLALGFLEWYDPDREPEKARLAPLVLVPIEIERHLERVAGNDPEEGKEGGGRKLRIGMKVYRYTIRHDGEDVSSNLALILRLRRVPFSLELEAYEAADDSENADEGTRFSDIDDYFDAIEKAVASLPRDVAVRPWRVIRAARVGFYTFFKEVMWRDLDPERWPEGAPLLNRPWITAALAGREKTSDPEISDSDVERAMHEEPLPTVLDADGSQMKVLLRVSRGESLVIQGPPGTGKSQTIANIIAAALAQGKTVLFMAEKLVALNVVKERLDQAWIGQFCLELHSRQASVKAIHDQLRRRLAIRAKPANPSDRSETLSRLLRHRNSLNQSWSLLKHPIEGLGCTCWQTIWAAVWFRQEFDEQTEHRYPGADLPVFWRGGSPTLDQLNAVLEKAAILRRLAADGIPERVRIWDGFYPKRIVSQDRVSAVRSAIEASLEAANTWREKDEAIFEPSLSGMTGTDTLRLFAALPETLPSSWQQPLASGVATGYPLDDYVEYLAAMAQWQSSIGTPEERLAEQPDLSDAQLADAESAVDVVRGKLPWLAGMTYSALRRAADQLGEARSLVGRRNELAGRLANALGLSAVPATLDEDHRLLRIARLWADLGRPDDCYLEVSLASAATKERLDAAEVEGRQLEEHLQQLETWFRIPDAPTADRLAWIRRTLSAAAGTWRAWWPFGEAAQARRAARAFLRSKRALKKSGLCDRLAELEAWPSRRNAFASNASHCRLLGHGFRGIETDWNRLRGAATLVQDVVSWLGSAPARTLLSRAMEIAETLGEAGATTEQLEDCIRDFAELLGHGAAGKWEGLLLGSRNSANEQLAEIYGHSARSVAALEPVRPADGEMLDAIQHSVAGARQLRRLRGRIEQLVSHSDFLGTAHEGIHRTQLDPLNETLRSVIALTGIHELPTRAASWLLATDSSARLLQLRQEIGSLGGALDSWRKSAEHLEAFAQIDPSCVLASANLDRPVRAVVEAFSNASAATTMLPLWTDYLHVKNWFTNNWHDDLLAFTAAHSLPIETFAALARAAFWDGWLRKAETLHPEVFALVRQEKETALEIFQTTDRSLPDLHRVQVVREIYRSLTDIAAGKQVGRAADLTDLALIQRELGKKKRHVSARELIRRSGQALRQLMPCWMMGPAAVAQFLPPGHTEFDVLVVDEASQVRPEDALGSLARTKQVIIVGDSKQMPPSDAFSVQSERDEEDEDEAAPAEELESILDVFNNFLPGPSLRWHYRSQHHSLILYSNEFFYDRDLLIPPSVQLGDGPLGVKWHFCAQPAYLKGRNPPEAREVAVLLAEHVLVNSVRPEEKQESVAVVAMNRQQQELIEELFDQLTKERPELADALERFKPTAPIIIRNLENIQGDERDVIIISFTYGPDVVTGVVAQRFGPVNRAGGWRRLNVLFTRARMRTVVVSSMRSEQVLPRVQQRDDGVVHLRNYLKFAETGLLPDAPVGPRREPDSEFECSVGRVVQSFGFEVHYQVGSEGFLIDLAIPDPASPARYLCGIECDGAPYHSHPTARDRDRLREEILRARGWDIYRIWSTDWYRSRSTEAERLRSYLEWRAAGAPQ
jgi:very-short-patch-repair endonuclease